MTIQSLNTRVQRIAALVDTKDITEWENDFILSILERTRDGRDTRTLTENQINVIDRIFHKHFA